MLAISLATCYFRSMMMITVGCVRVDVLYCQGIHLGQQQRQNWPRYFHPKFAFSAVLSSTLLTCNYLRFVHLVLCPGRPTSTATSSCKYTGTRRASKRVLASNGNVFPEGTLTPLSMYRCWMTAELRFNSLILGLARILRIAALFCCCIVSLYYMCGR